MFTKQHTCGILLVLFALFWSGSLIAQGGSCTHILSLGAPAAGATGVSLNPEILINCNNTIDAASLNYESPVCIQVTTGTCAPSIYLLRQNDYLTLTEGTWKFVAEYITTVSVSASQIRITLPPEEELDPGTKYAIAVRGLTCYEASYGCPADVNQDWAFAFETADISPQLTSYSLDDGKPISCMDKITLGFNRALSTLYPSGNPLVEVKKVGAFQTSTSTYAVSSESISPSLSMDGKTVTIYSNSSWTPGESYVLYVNQNLLDGDANNKLSINFSARELGYATFTTAVVGTAASVTTGSMYFSLGETHPIYPSTTMVFSAPLIVGDLCFKRWLCDDEPTIDKSTNNVFNVWYDCSTLKELNVTAEYAPVPVRKLRVAKSTVGTVFADGYNSSNATSTNNCYNLLRGKNKFLELVAIPATGYEFEKWVSDDSDFNNNSSPRILIPIKDPRVVDIDPNPGDFAPVFKPINILPAGACSELTLTVNVECDPAAKIDIKQLVTVSLGVPWSINGDNVSDYKSYVNDNPADDAVESHDVTVTINPAYTGCYEIESFVLYRNGSIVERRAGSQDDPLGLSTIDVDGIILRNSVNPPDQQCNKYLAIRVRRLTKTLTIEAKMSDGQFIPYLAGLSLQQDIAREQVLSGANGVWKAESPQSSSMIKKTLVYEYLCDDDAVWFPQIESWASGIYSYTDWQCPLGADPDPATGLTCQSITNASKDEITVRMDRDKLICYEFATTFRLLQIGYTDSENPGAIAWRNVTGPNSFPNSEEKLVDMYIATDGSYFNRPEHRYYPQLKFRFNLPVDESTLEGGNLRVRDLGFRYGTDRQNRYDNLGFQTYDYKIGTNSETLEDGGTVAVFNMKTSDGSGLYMCHSNLMKIYVQPDAKSATNVALINPITEGVKIATENPALHIRMKYIQNVMLGDHCIWGGQPDVFVFGHAAYNNGVYVPNALTQANSNLRWPSSGAWDGMQFTETRYPGTTMLQVQKLDDIGTAAYGFVMIDEGGGNTSDNYATAMASVEAALKVVNAVDASAPAGWNIGGAIAQAILTFLSGDLCDDFPMHRGETRLLKANRLWDCTQLYKIRDRFHGGHRGNVMIEYWLGDN